MWQFAGYLAISALAAVAFVASWWYYRHSVRKTSGLRNRQLERIVAEQRVRP
jgi:hypothetical protein